MSCLQRRNYGNLGETVNAMLEMNAMATSNKFDTMETVAHDFNNLLTGILGNRDLMQMRAQRRGITEFVVYLTGSRSAANRAVSLTQRLLAVSGQLAHQ